MAPKIKYKTPQDHFERIVQLLSRAYLEGVSRGIWDSVSDSDDSKATDVNLPNIDLNSSSGDATNIRL